MAAANQKKIGKGPAPKRPQFPSVSTHLPAAQVAQNYNSLGIPFTAPAGTCVMNLATFFGTPAINTITASGKAIFHTLGDTGVQSAEQEAVANAMAADINN